MTKKLTTLISLMFVLGAINVSLGANEVQLQGVITKISGSTIIIKGYNGREFIIEGTLKGIEVGELVQVRRNDKLIKLKEYEK